MGTDLFHPKYPFRDLSGLKTREVPVKSHLQSVSILVVAALIYDGDRLLVCQRRADGSFPLKWEFPGGKLEVGEDPLAALRRELEEELGIQVQSAKEIFRNIHSYPNGITVELFFFKVGDFRGTIRNRAFQQITWLGIRELESGGHGTDAAPEDRDFGARVRRS